jgi:hypothetical protein
MEDTTESIYKQEKTEKSSSVCNKAKKEDKTRG